MSKMVMLVFSDAVSAEREAAYNEWYDNTHLADVTAIPGVLSARRFKLADVASAFGGVLADGARYLALYEIETADPEGVEREMRERLGDGRLRPTDTMASDPPALAVYFHEL
jgi:hypothetical protein